MDPLSITVAVPALAGMVFQLVSLIKKFVEAHAHVTKLRSDVQQFRCELELLSRQLKRPQYNAHLLSARDHIEEVLTAAWRAIHELSSILQKVSSENGEQLKVRQLSWIMYERDCREHHLHLAECLEKLKRLKKMAAV
jgi:hypothetical protein